MYPPGNEQIAEPYPFIAGPLVQAGLFRTAEGDHLFLAIHHLVMDGVSFRILLEDLSKTYEQAMHGELVVLPSKTDSYQTWTTRLLEYSASGEFLKENSILERI
nr:condensation domain-containing protein [Paenibacillus larvae]